MNRKILFRGKSVKYSNWYYGDLIQYEITNNYYIKFYQKDSLGVVDDYCYEVIPETIGQYIGIKDKNNNRIFEGDIVKMETLATCEDYDCKIGVINFNDSTWKLNKRALTGYYRNVYSFEVLGNIYDNQELING